MEKIKFAHLADLHLGAYREKTMTKLNFKTFQKAINKILKDDTIKFVLFAGDIFNTAIPSFEIVESVIIEFRKLKEKQIPIYVIGGSHDYSDMGKSFISILDKTGIFEDVFKIKQTDNNAYELIITTNHHLKLNIAGIVGKKKQLDKNIYNNLKTPKLNQEYLNIFMLHTMLDDMKPSNLKNIKSELTSNLLPKGFNYYAAGHVHYPMSSKYQNAIISYPSALFPNNFYELKTIDPSFNLCEYDFKKKEIKLQRIILKTYQKEIIQIDINKKTTYEAKEKIENTLEELEIKDKLILLEITGIIEGKISDLELNKTIANLYNRGALHVLKNTYKLTTLNQESLEITGNENIEEKQKKIIQNYINTQEDLQIIDKILSLDLSKQEDEKQAIFEQRIIDIFDKI